jgi:heat shock protein HslJ
MLRPHTLRLAAAIILVVLVLASCSGTAEDGADTTLAPTATTLPPTTTAAPTTPTEPAVSVEAPELADTSWNVINYRLPSGSITNVWLTDVTISFSADGTVSGSAGCNVYEGNWSVSGALDAFESGVPDSNDGQELILDSLSWTEMACEDDSIMEQEAEFLDLLQDAGRWVLIREEFNLRDAEGGFLFSAVPV